MDKFNLVAYPKVIQMLGVDLKSIPGWGAWNVHWPPGARDNRINNYFLRIDPDYSQIHKYEKHVDRRINPTVLSLYEEQSRTRIKM
jgi:hypothetical protein